MIIQSIAIAVYYNIHYVSLRFLWVTVITHIRVTLCVLYVRNKKKTACDPELHIVRLVGEEAEEVT